MNYRVFAATAIIVASGLGGCSARHAIPTSAGSPPTQVAIPRTTLPPPGDLHAVQQAVATAVEQGVHSAPYRVDFPQGCHVNSVHIEGGVASIDFSSDFSKLADMGDTTESNAQKALCRLLSAFPGVSKATVSVDGKAFESQNTDWSIPFDTKSPGGESGSAKSGDSPSTSL